VFVRVTLCAALVVPTGVLKETEVGEKSTVPTAPFPESPMVCGEPGASSVMVTVFDRAPDASGRNSAEIVHVPEAATVEGLNGQVVAEIMKSDPAGTEMLEIVSGTP
jgi:hypothetical protein